MKKVITFLLAILALCRPASAQLVVDSLGLVGIGTTSPRAALSVNNTAGISRVVEILQGNTSCGLYMKSKPFESSCNIPESSTGLYAEALVAENKKHIGLHSFVRSAYFRTPSSESIGIMGEGLGAKSTIGIYGKASVLNDSTNLAVGVYGSVGSHGTGIYGSGKYAGYFYGPIKVTGRIYGTTYSPTSTSVTSSASMCKSLNFANETGESIIDKLLSVQTLQFVREEDVSESFLPTQTLKCQDDLVDDCQIKAERIIDEETKREDILSEKLNHKTEMIKHYGLDAEQLMDVFPELVIKDQQGDFCINYSEMVPLLLQSIRELSARVDELEVYKNAKTQKAKAKFTSRDRGEIDVVHMSQNVPNPFDESCVISLNIPQEAKNATIYIFDLSGKQLKSYIVDERGETNVMLSASDYQAGMFVYSLVIDGVVVSTRKMMVVRK